MRLTFFFSVSESTGEKIKDKVTGLFSSKDKKDDNNQSSGYGNEGVSGGYRDSDRRDY